MIFVPMQQQSLMGAHTAQEMQLGAALACSSGSGAECLEYVGHAVIQEPLHCHKKFWPSAKPERRTNCVGTAAGGSIGMQLGARGAMPGIPGGMQMNQGPPGPMTQLLQQEGPPPPLHTTSALMPGASEVCHLRCMSLCTSCMPSAHAMAAHPALYKLSQFHTHE